MLHNCSNQSDGISDYPGYFIRMDDGKLKSPFHQNLNLTALQITVSSVAIPLNLLLMFAILSKHELRSKPRNIFLISVISSDLSAFILSLIEVGEVFLPKESEEAKDQVCKVYMAYSGIPMIFTLVTTILSLIDRYIAAESPLWHRSKMTTFWATFGVMSTMIIAVFVTKFLYIFQIVPLLCGIHTLERKMLNITAVTLVFLCLIWRIIVYFQTRRLLRSQNIQAPPIQAPTIHHQPENSKGNQDNNQDQIPEIEAQPHLRDEATPMRRNCSQIRYQEMESEAVKNLASGVTTLLILFSPIVIFVSAKVICRTLYSSDQVCNKYSWLSGYLKQLHQLYGLYHPILYLGWNKEFYFILRIPLSRMISRLSTLCYRTRTTSATLTTNV